jgi:hypothetical protein
MNNSIEYNRQRDGVMTPSTRYLQQRQFMIPPQMLLQTAPSYVSANRSISNQSVSNRSVSNRSFATSSRPNHTAVTQEAERIAMATTQAQAAAQSILLTGGSQASALSTAKAAAKSVLQPTMMEGEKLPVGSTRTNKFRNRRKNRQHAEIIASMALVSANEALGYSTTGNDMMMTPGSRSIYQDGRDSEYPDDYTSYRSIGPNSIHGRSHSIRSQSLQYPQYYEIPRQDKKNLNASKMLGPSESSVPHYDKTITGSIELDQNVLKTKGSMRSEKPQIFDATISKNPSIKEYFLKKQLPAEENETEPLETMKPKTKIPAEMPMPKSNSMKFITALKGSNSGKQSMKVERNATPQARQQTESQMSYFSDSSASHTNSFSFAESTNGENTADYTRDTYESVVENKRKSSFGSSFPHNGTNFFSTMDPFVVTFSEVFSCAPVPSKQTQKKFQHQTMRLKHRESRDASVTQSFVSNRKEEERAPAPPALLPPINVTDAVPKRSTSVEDSTLSGIDLVSLEDNAEMNVHKKTESPTKRKSVKSPSMEQLVLRALSAMSPKSAASKRPKLNVKPLKQSTSPLANSAIAGLPKYRSFNDGSRMKRTGSTRKGMDMIIQSLSKQSKNMVDASNNSETNASLSIEGINKRPGFELNSSSSKQRHSESSEYYNSTSDDSANVPIDTLNVVASEAPVIPNENKLKRFPSFFHRPKKLKNEIE